MSRYRGGADFEREVRKHLVIDGYEVIRSAGSKTKVDLLAFKSGQVLIVQCKRGGTIGPAERREVIRIAGLIPTAVPVVASRPKVTLQRLTGPGPRDREPFSTDVEAAT